MIDNETVFIIIGFIIVVGGFWLTMHLLGRKEK